MILALKAHCPIKQVILGDQEEPQGESDVQFRLTYEGPLFARSRGISDHKHQIRQSFHKQLKRFWDYHPFFKNSKAWVYDPPRGTNPITPTYKRKEQLGDLFTRAGYKFVPVASRDLCVYCSLDILFLRPEPPGELLLSGDIDNRIKTLVDALKMPSSAQDLGRYTTPQEGEELFFVLLEDDRLVTRLNVETDMLLEPTSLNPNKSDCRLVISVTLTPYQSIWGNMGV